MGEMQAQLISEADLIQKGSEVKVRRPRAGESGVWTVLGSVATSEPDDSAWEVTNTITGRRRIFRSSRLILLRQARKRGT